MAAPWSETWNPPRDSGAEKPVLRGKTRPEGRLFVNQHEQVKQQPDRPAVFHQRDASEEQALTENGAHHCYVHRISDMAIESGNHQMAGWEGRRGRADSPHGESDKRIQEANDPQASSTSRRQIGKSALRKRQVRIANGRSTGAPNRPRTQGRRP